MTDDLLTKNPMNEDLLTKIQRETHERLRELRGAVDEHDRLAGELRALQDVPARQVASEPPAALEVVPELRVVPEQHVGLDVESEPPATPEAVLEPSPDTAPPANVVRLPARPYVHRTRMVSPKVARLMRAPRRPALERAGVVRVGAGRVDASAEDDLWPQDAGEDVDADAEVYERAI
jgi:hypothetical protein